MKTMYVLTGIVFWLGYICLFIDVFNLVTTIGSHEARVVQMRRRTPKKRKSMRY